MCHQLFDSVVQQAALSKQRYAAMNARHWLHLVCIGSELPSADLSRLSWTSDIETCNKDRTRTLYNGKPDQAFWICPQEADDACISGVQSARQKAFSHSANKGRRRLLLISNLLHLCLCSGRRSCRSQTIKIPSASLRSVYQSLQTATITAQSSLERRLSEPRVWLTITGIPGIKQTFDRVEQD